MCCFSRLSLAGLLMVSAAPSLGFAQEGTPGGDELEAVPPPPAAPGEAPASAGDEFDARFDEAPAVSPASSSSQTSALSAPNPMARSSAASTPAAVSAPPSPAPATQWRLFVSDDISAVRRRHRRDRWAPALQPGDRIEARLMPFAGDANGALGLFSWRHQTPSGFWTSLRLGPFGFAHAGPDTVAVADGAAFIGMAWRLFEVGVGGGLGFVRVEDTTRRTRGLAPTYLCRFRVGALYGAHFSLTTGGAYVDGDGVQVMARLRLRIPIRHHDLLDFDIDVAPGLAWVYTGVSWERGLGDRDRSRLRLRPNIGIVEVIDPVRRDGGAGFTVGVALVYRTDGPMPEPVPDASPEPQSGG